MSALHGHRTLRPSSILPTTTLPRWCLPLPLRAVPLLWVTSAVPTRKIGWVVVVAGLRAWAPLARRLALWGGRRPAGSLSGARPPPYPLRANPIHLIRGASLSRYTPPPSLSVFCPLLLIGMGRVSALQNFKKNFSGHLPLPLGAVLVGGAGRRQAPENQAGICCLLATLRAT